MYRLSLNAKKCVSCGICQDVCPHGAIALRPDRSVGIEGDCLMGGMRGNVRPGDVAVVPKGTFPFLRAPGDCDGCGMCVRECPVLALMVHHETGVKAVNSDCDVG